MNKKNENDEANEIKTQGINLIDQTFEFEN